MPALNSWRVLEASRALMPISDGFWRPDVISQRVLDALWRFLGLHNILAEHPCTRKGGAGDSGRHSSLVSDVQLEFQPLLHTIAILSCVPKISNPPI